jgi:bla regulator protein blaR1
MIAALDLKTIAEISATRMVDCVLEGTAVAVLAALTLRAIHRQNSGTRFAVWFSTLMAMAILPLADFAWSAGRGGVQTGGASNGAAVVVPGSWALYLFAAWAALASVALVRVGAGLVQLRKIRRSCIEIDPQSLSAPLRAILENFQAIRPVVLCVSSKVQSPTAIGFLKPAIVIPSWLMEELSAEELNQVLLHELAHLRRWDDWTNLAQKLIKALLFFHPAVWWIEQRISLEREMACDDAVLAETASPRSYAECLTRLAEKSLLRRSLTLAQTAVGRIRQTSLRVTRILDKNRPAGSTRVWKPVVSLAAGFACVCAVFVSSAPELVAFQDNVPAAQRVVANTPVTAAKEKAPEPSEMAKAAPASVLGVKTRARRTVSSSSIPAKYVVADAQRNTNAASLVHLTAARLRTKNSTRVVAAKATSASIATEALFVVVEGNSYGAAGQPLYQISVWRFVVVRDPAGVIDPATPRKQI